MASPPKVNHTKSVLVIDDDPNVQAALQRILRPQGFMVTVANDGFHAGEWLSHIKPDVITLDITMPVLDCAETLKAIRSITKLDNTKILILSGKSSAELLPLLRLGANAIMEKPVKSDKLIQMIRSLAGVELA
jgi:CheY-like chemotaxis protein